MSGLRLLWGRAGKELGLLPPDGRTVRKVGWGTGPGLLFQVVSFEAASPLSGFCLPRAWAPGASAPWCPPPCPHPLFSLFPWPLTRPRLLFLAFPLFTCAVQTLPVALGPIIRSSIPSSAWCLPGGPCQH